MQTAEDIKGDSNRPTASIEALIEALNSPVAIVDRDWLIVSANARLLDRFSDGLWLNDGLARNTLKAKMAKHGLREQDAGPD